MGRLIIFSTIILLTVLHSCATTKSTTILYSENYDATNDRTSVLMFPYGEIKIPGRWKKISENGVSGQYFFINQDSTIIAIALNPWNKYEFSNKNPEVTTDNFVRKFYEWDATYLKEQINGEMRILTENKDENYLIWNLVNEKSVNDYYLFGLKGDIAYNLSITTEKWSEDSKVEFLELLFAESK